MKTWSLIEVLCDALASPGDPEVSSRPRSRFPSAASRAKNSRTHMNEPDPIPTRWSLLSRLKSWDDQESWREFFDIYWSLLYSVSLRAGLTDAEAQDVVQETIIAVARRMKDFKANAAAGSFKGWLLHTTRWKIADQLRKRRAEPGAKAENRRPVGDEDTHRTATVERIPDPASLVQDSLWDEQWEQNLRTAAIESVKRQVDPLEYQIFDLCVMRGSPPKTVATKLGVKLWKVYLAQKKVAGLLLKEARRIEAET
jgi:RNA polymerase sigma-70 factor (ECF subfamily)